MNFIDKLADEIVRKLNMQISESISTTLMKVIEKSHDWFVSVIPDLTGYATLATGAAVIISSAAGNGMQKPLGIYSCVLITSVCILVGT